MTWGDQAMDLYFACRVWCLSCISRCHIVDAPGLGAWKGRQHHCHREAACARRVTTYITGWCYGPSRRPSKGGDTMQRQQASKSDSGESAMEAGSDAHPSD
jgi:hypothetical protein